MSVLKDIEKTPLQSKKFVAYLITNFLNKALLFYLVYKDIDAGTLIWAITAAIFIDTGYILGVVALELFVKLASIRGGYPAPVDVAVVPPKDLEEELTKP